MSADQRETGPADDPTQGRLARLAEQITIEQQQAAAAAFRSLPVASAALRLAESAETRVSNVAAASAQRRELACEAGCAACCRLAVAITAPEAIRIVHWLRARRSPAELGDLRQRVAGTSAQASHLSLEGRARARVACALLLPDGNCGVYEVRPIGCRGWTSFSRPACEAALTNAEPGHSGPMDAETWAAAGAATFGLQSGLRARGLDAAHYELHSMLLWAMENERVGEGWARGESLARRCSRVTSEKLKPAEPT